MQILSIEIEGLWSYRDPQRIDLTGLPLVVGVGANGAGKSAILVAAVLAGFYGVFATRTVEESITTGSAQGHVSIEFLVHGTRYRVGRVYPRTGSATGVLAVEDSSQATGWRTLTESGVREVTARVTELLGMDHKTATMTWIAEQGQYGKFASAQPAERFKLLTSIFGLDEYAAKADAAKAKWKAADTDVTRLDGRIAELQDALERVEAAGAHADLTDEQISERIAALDTTIDQVSQALAELNATDPARKTVEARQALELVRNARQAARAEATAARSRAAHAGLEAQTRANAARQAAETRHQQSVASAKHRSAAARDTANNALRAAREQLALIAQTEDTLSDLADAVAAHRDEESEARHNADQVTKELSAARSRRAVLLAEWGTLKVNVEDAGKRIEMLDRSAEDDSHAECFTCSQHLTTEEAAALIGMQQTALAGFRQRQAEVKAEGEDAKTVITQLEAQKAAHLATAEQHDAAAAAAAAELSRAEGLVATKAEKRAVEARAHDALAQAVEDESEALAIAADQRHAAITDADEQEQAALTVAAADEAAAAERINATSEPTAEENRLAQELADAEARVADAAATVAAQRTRLETERAAARDERQALTREAARRREAAAVRADQETRLATLTGERDVAVQDRLLHHTLLKAFSPTGIPAMVLAGLIDELNESVNSALHRLSNGELEVELRTSRATAGKTSENKVTVYVRTSTGTRAYETLSGGQKFRVDLAIRTGLAATIARGSGTPIQTLILDEGWGSLDEKGILSTVDTLFRLSDEVNILTVSHIDAVRDSFPSRVEVSMVGGNSVAEVVAA